MSQNTPNDPGYNDHVTAHEPVEDSSNPYFQAGSRQQEPDLDAAAPALRNEENQRLNRKALLFLGGIVLLLAAMVALILTKVSKDDAPKNEKVKAVAPFVPPSQPVDVALPQLPPLPSTPEVSPIEIADLPPLPESRPSRSDSFQDGRPHQTGPTLVERRMANGAVFGVGGAGEGVSGDLMAQTLAQRDARVASNMSLISQGQAGAGAPQNDDGGSVSAQRESPTQASFLRNADHLLLRGTYIRCVLETRIITDYSGFTSCIVTEPVYSVNGRELLLPRGSKVAGSYNSSVKADRVGVVWDRITTPNGVDVKMSSPGVDGLGGAGHPGDLNSHWGSRIASALMISLLSDAFKYAAAEHGPGSSAITDGGTIYSQPYESATARTMERMAGQVLEQSMGRAPTVTINQGTVVNVYVAKDVDFSGVMPPRR